MKFKASNKNGADISEFLRIFLTSFDHNPNETIYFVIAFIDLYKRISEKNNLV